MVRIRLTFFFIWLEVDCPHPPRKRGPPSPGGWGGKRSGYSDLGAPLSGLGPLLWGRPPRRRGRLLPSGRSDLDAADCSGFGAGCCFFCSGFCADSCGFFPPRERRLRLEELFSPCGFSLLGYSTGFASALGAASCGFFPPRERRLRRFLTAALSPSGAAGSSP